MVTVSFNADKAAIELTGPWDPHTQFHLFLRNLADDRYLSPTGWSAVPTTVPADLTVLDDGIRLDLEAGVVAIISPGTRLAVEDVFNAIYAELVWPYAPKTTPTPKSVNSATAIRTPTPDETPARAYQPLPLPYPSPDTSPRPSRARPIAWLVLGVVAGICVSILPVGAPLTNWLIGTVTTPLPIADTTTMDSGESTKSASAITINQPSSRLLEETRSLRSQLNASETTIAELRRTLGTGFATIRQLKSQLALPSPANISAAAELATATARIEELESNLSTLIEQQSDADNVIPTRAVWGAAALGGDGQMHTIQNQISEASAEEIALKLCAGGSGRNCRRITSYNNACFSLARVRGQGARVNNWEYRVDHDWNVAEREALNQCQQNKGAVCTIRYTVCSPDVLSKPEQ